MGEWLEQSSQARPIPAKRSAAEMLRQLRDSQCLDASVVVELLLNSALGHSIRGDLAGRDDDFSAPHVLVERR